MDAFLNIKYKQVSVSDNYDDYMKFIGANLFMRKASSTMHPVSILTKEGDVYTLAMNTPIKSFVTTFKLNEEFVKESFDGSKAKTIITIEGNKMIQVQTDPNGKTSKIVREFSADRIIMSATADGWNDECTRVFEKIN